MALADDLTFARDLALRVGTLLDGFFHGKHLDVGLKDDRTLVTEADLRADELVTSAIGERYPDDYVLSEERETSYAPTSPGAWVVDPLDGTANFALGLHGWGVSIARMWNGEPVAGVLHFPAVGETFTAIRSQGARLNGMPVRVADRDPRHGVGFFACSSRVYRRYDVTLPYKTRILGSATYTLGAVARGTALIAFESTPRIWDIAAAWVVVREAGGVIEAFEGPSPFPLQAGIEYRGRVHPTLAAATPALLAEARAHIRRKPEVG